MKLITLDDLYLEWIFEVEIYDFMWIPKMFRLNFSEYCDEYKLRGYKII